MSFLSDLPLRTVFCRPAFPLPLPLPLLWVLALVSLFFSPHPGTTAESIATPSTRPRIVILGDSITAGYGLDPSEAYPALLQKKVREAGFLHEVINAGVSGDTTAGGLRRVDWVLRQPVDILVVALGGNDGLRGISPSITQSNLGAIFDKVRAKYPPAKLLLAGMQMPPNMGEDYVQAYRSIFPDVSASRKVVLIPFLLQGVGGQPEFNQPDQIHPTSQGQALIANTVWDVLRTVMETAPRSASEKGAN